MKVEEFKDALVEYYQGELMGEAVIEQMIKNYDEPERHAKLAVLLQLETETKARLRPAMMELGMRLDEEDAPRAEARQIAEAFKSLSWEQAMGAMCEQLPPVIAHYRDIADKAPQAYRDLAESMFLHEKSLLDFAEMEVKGEIEHSIDVVSEQLHFKLPAYGG
ncbi:MAG: hypothetical protein AAGF35_05245 [Pseudomonadota bacterium]